TRLRPWSRERESWTGGRWRMRPSRCYQRMRLPGRRALCRRRETSRLRLRSADSMTTTLARRPLGRTGLAVTTLGFGCAPLGELYARLDAGSGYVGGLAHRAAFDYSYDGALRALDQSLLRLATDRVEIALIHD